VSEQPDSVELVYRNWRGEVRPRKIRPLGAYFGSTQWHPEPQWLLNAVDLEDGATKQFALKDFLGAPHLPSEPRSDVVETLEYERDQALRWVEDAHEALDSFCPPPPRVVRGINDLKSAGFEHTLFGRIEKLREMVADERESRVKHVPVTSRSDDFADLRYVVSDEERRPIAAFRDEETARDFWRPIKNSCFKTLTAAEMVAPHVPSSSCEGQKCPCGAKATRKVGEEEMWDRPIVGHNLTSYVCDEHFWWLMGPSESRKEV
jgi:hypothetical protein